MFVFSRYGKAAKRKQFTSRLEHWYGALFFGYNLRQNKWNIWTTGTPPTYFIEAKMARFCSFDRAFMIALEGEEINYSISFCPKLILVQNKWNIWISPLPHFNDGAFLLIRPFIITAMGWGLGGS